MIEIVGAAAPLITALPGLRRLLVEPVVTLERVSVGGEGAVANATPIGMTGMPGNPVPMDAVRADQWVADVIYSPIETELIAAARAKGARTLTGGGMCVWQGVDAFRLFTGIAPDPARMRAAFARALAERDALS